MPAWLDAGQRFRGLACDGAFVDIGVPGDWRRAAQVIGVPPAGREDAPAPADALGDGALVRLRRNVAAAVAAQQRMLADVATMAAFDAAVATVVERYRSGGRLYVAGNGGSAADAQHLAAEFVSKLARDRAPLPAEALTTDSSILTAIGNDYGFDKVFERQLAGKAGPRDVFLAITTSGESPNILRALEHCRRVGLPSIVLTGRGGGRARALADHCVAVPGAATSTIQELHIVLAHTLCECVEAALFGTESHDLQRNAPCPATSS
jgi:D-sedoheptulose 7-phosphate isomerase